MSKIQDALSKLQSPKTGKPRTEAGRSRASKKSPDGLPVGSLEMDAAPGFAGPELTIDIAALRASGLVPPEAQQRELAGQYREIKRPLIMNAFGKRVATVEDGRLIAVTSSVPGEGKTFTCINLAMSIAQEQDYSVLLVDGDLAKPHISNVFGVGNELGLLDLLEDHSLDPRSVISNSDIPGFSLLPAGRPRQHATELLSSTRMEQVIRFLAESDERRIIVFDTSPLLRTSEAKVLTSLVGQVVLVVKSESTPQGAVVEAVKTLSPSQAVNLLLNQSMSGAASYNYGYNYQYDSHSGVESPPKIVDTSTGEAGRKKRGLWE